MKTLLIVLGALLLAACSPEFDWREIRPEDQGYAVLLPGKPVSMTRRIFLESIEAPMTMYGARVDDASFTVAVVDLPKDGAAVRAQALAAMRAGMVRNIQGTETDARVIQVRLHDPAGSALSRLEGTRIDASGTVQGRPVRMSAGFVAHGDRAWQWVAIGAALEAEQLATFLDSFRLVQERR